MQTRFERLSALLEHYLPIIQSVAFAEETPAWVSRWPALADALLALPESQLLQLQGNDDALAAYLAPVFPDAQAIAELCRLPETTQGTAGKPLSDDEYKRWATGIHGRKSDQINAFVAAVGECSEPVLDWCSGKLFLGDLLQRTWQLPVTGLEKDPALVEAANRRLGTRHTDETGCVECDVLTAEVESFIQSQHHVVALHACGGLHQQLLRKASGLSAERISLAPCCYHRFLPEGGYRPLSEAGQKSGLRWTQDDLRNAVRQSVTASGREVRQRRQLQAWRLGFDALQRAVRGEDTYLPTPPVSVTCLQDGFAVFCQQMAELKAITRPADFDAERWLKAGQARLYRYERLELARMLFRRPLELWLVIDQYLYLQGQGYKCRLLAFCPTELTPRNLLLDARKHHGHTVI